MGKKFELNLPLKATAVFKKHYATRIPLQLQERVQHFLDTLTHFDKIAPVNTDSLTTGKPLLIQQLSSIKENHLKLS